MKTKFASLRSLIRNAGISLIFCSMPFVVLGEEAKNATIPDKEFSCLETLLKRSAGYYNLKRTSDGKIDSVILVVEIPANANHPGITQNNYEKARLQAWGMLAELSASPVFTVETSKAADGKESKVIKKTVTAQFTGCLLSLIASGKKADGKAIVFVFQCVQTKHAAEPTSQQ